MEEDKLIKISGQLVETSNYEEHDLLGLKIDNKIYILTKYLYDEYSIENEIVTINYFISENNLSEEKLKEVYIKKCFGILDLEYSVAYSEYTGYLWTTETFDIGGHNLVEELSEHLGKYLYMTITVHEKTKENIKKAQRNKYYEGR